MKIIFTGDLMPGGEFEEQYLNAKISNEHPFSDLITLFNDADLVIPNLECPLKFGTNERIDKSSILGCSGSLLKKLNEWNFKVVNLSNNHIHDYGQTGIKKTLDELDSAGIKYFGLISEGNKSGNTFICEDGKFKIGFVAFTTNDPWVKSVTKGQDYVCEKYSKRKIKEKILALKKVCSFIVLFFHWGFENQLYPSPKQIRLARYAISLGADLIIGHHPHIVQCYEKYKGKYIFYSLGHIFFSNFYSKEGKLFQFMEYQYYGLLIKLMLDEKNNSINILPVFQEENFNVKLLDESSGNYYLSKLESYSSKLKKNSASYFFFWLKYHLNIEIRRYFRIIKRNFISQKSVYFKLKSFLKALFMLFRSVITSPLK